MDKKKKKTWIQYGIFAAVVIFLFTTGLHTEVIGYAQRGLLATGLMNPDVSIIVQARNEESTNASVENLNQTKVDFN